MNKYPTFKPFTERVLSLLDKALIVEVYEVPPRSPAETDNFVFLLKPVGRSKITFVVKKVNIHNEKSLKLSDYEFRVELYDHDCINALVSLEEKDLFCNQDQMFAEHRICSIRRRFFKPSALNSNSIERMSIEIEHINQDEERGFYGYYFIYLSADLEEGDESAFFKKHEKRVCLTLEFH